MTCYKIKTVSNILYMLSIVVAIISGILYYCKILDKITITIALFFYLFANIVCFVCDCLLTKEKMANQKGRRIYKLFVFQKIAKTLWTTMMLVSYLLYNYNYDDMFLCFAILSLIIAIVSFVFWYEYKVELSKIGQENNDGVVL